MEKCLGDDWYCNNTFSFYKSYQEAPNPALQLDNMGTVGVPLSSRDANAIKERAQQAPFGMGERTVVDKTVRDTWEVDAQQASL